jgi:fumarate hydratase subunit beta
MRAHELRTPFAREALAELRIGERVLITGTLLTARDAAHARFAEAIAAGEPLPVDVREQVLYFVGPTPARPGKPIGSAGPTTASRMDAYSPRLIERGLRAMIGKGRRSGEVRRAMAHHGCVYFGAVEGTAALLAGCVSSAEVIAYPGLGAEAVRRLEVVDFPAVLASDLAGRDLYEEGPMHWRRRERPS